MGGLRKETPPADCTAHGVKIKAGEASRQEYSKHSFATTLAPLREAHVARICGLTDQRASLIAALAFAGCAS